MPRELHILDSERGLHNKELEEYRKSFSKERVLDMEDCEFRDLFEKQIDYQLLKDIFLEMFDKYGVEHPDFGILEVGRIYDEKSDDMGGYDPNLDIISLNYDISNKKSTQAKSRFGIDVSANLILFRTYLHEVVHALSKMRSVASLNEDGSTFRGVEMGGFRISDGSGDEIENYDIFFVDFDEGVTEILSDKIFQEYCRRAQLFSQTEVSSFKSIDTMRIDETVGLVNEMLRYLVDEGYMTEEKVWEMINKGKFNGVEKIHDWISELEGIFGKSFVYMLAMNYTAAMRLKVRDLTEDMRKFEAYNEELNKRFGKENE